MSDRAFLFGSAIVVVVLVALVFFMFFPATEVKSYEVELSDFVFVLKDGEFPIKVKVGETIRFKIRNVGGFEHEFMIVTADMKDKMADEALDLINSLMDMGLSGEDLLEEFEKRFETHHEEEGVLLEVVLEPGEETVVEIVFEEPGTCYIICLEAEGTIEAGKTHFHQGMFAEIIVEE